MRPRDGPRANPPVLLTFARPFFDICCFRRGPQDLPASSMLLALAGGGYLLVNTGLLALSQPLPRAAAAAAVETVLLGALVYPVLALRGVSRRWLQTTTAMAGTGLLFSGAALPLFAGLLALRTAQGGPEILSLLIVVLIIWNVGVTAHIFRHALSAPFAAGLLAALAYVWVLTVGVSRLVPDLP
jgi:hypothetical protein